MGLRGRAVLTALIEGESDPDVLLALINRRVKAPREKVRAALRGRVTDTGTASCCGCICARSMR